MFCLFADTEEELMETTPSYERPILTISFIIFFIYFGILRESNDIDEKLGASLFDHMPELELPMIETAIQNYEMRGMDTRELRERFAELKQLKEEAERLEKQQNSNPGSKT